MGRGRLIGLTGIVCVVAVGFYLSTRIEVPVSFTRPCRLLAQSEWLLLQTGPDTFEARLLDRAKSSHQQIDLFRFERGDVVRFSLSHNVVPGVSVGSGQEIARLESYENRQLLDQLRPQLAEAQAGLRSAETGERNEIIALARSEVEAFRARCTRRESEFTRAASMWDQGIISQAEYELAEARHLEAQAELRAAENRLQAAEAGEKDAIVEGWQARVDLLAQQIEDAQARIEARRIRCPIDGAIVTLQGDTALVRVADLDTLYAVAPVPPSRAGMLKPGQSVLVHATGCRGERLSGEVLRVDCHAAALAGRTFIWVTAAIPNPDCRLTGGICGKVRFHGERASLLGWFIDRFRHASDRTLGA
jgi:multidrug efflux pump subunit AcrA (membrane-fusion protein)